uniref:Uncharacterized protein n=1 Tax=Ditylenchus dipsaci TaxID=166011 RepID=A0A915D297_9BILA
MAVDQLKCIALILYTKKHGDSKFRPADESRLMKWREEWNHGVQMPLCAQDTRETYTFEKVCLFPNSKQDEDVFELPRKYIALTGSATLRCHLQILNLKHGHHSQIKENVLLDVMNALEIDCYKKIHLALLESLIAPVRNTDNTDDDAECDICRMPEWEPGDEIVFVMAVISVCIKAATDLTQFPQMNEVRFGDVERREPITCVNEVPAERWQSKCSYRMQHSFHVSCAQRGGLVLRIEHSAEKNSGVAMISLCRKHSASSLIVSITAKERTSTSSPDKNHIDLEICCKTFLILSTAKRSQKYWQTKRKEK